MDEIRVSFDVKTGPVKPMHATNNGPVYAYYPGQRVSNIGAYLDAGIPFVRTHDSAEIVTYGGPHVVDITGIFPDFDRDPYDPASYDFRITDEYLDVIERGGSKVFYRLGQTIEHWPKKYGVLPPKDFKKWAVICEHVIRHYTEGWADGFRKDIEYWEIWNEADGSSKKKKEDRSTWGGTDEEFFEFYSIVFHHLKSCFPHLKIGGPSLAHDLEWAQRFLASIPEEPDFFSWHIYGKEPSQVLARASGVRKLLDERGFTKSESILNEWNYVCGWTGEDWVKSLREEKMLKGSAFIASTMSVCQYSSVDMLMYYSAAPHIMNGMFTYGVYTDLLKGYYPFRMFNELYKLGESVETEAGEDLYASAAVSGQKGALMLTRYRDDESDTAGKKRIRIRMKGLSRPEGILAQMYLLSEDKDMELVREEVYTGDVFSVILDLAPYETVLVKLSPWVEEI